MQREQLCQEGMQALEAFLHTAGRPLILHISDTDTECYPFAKQVLARVAPDLTIHTGDMADEWKAGRIPEHVPAYLAAVPALLDAMEQHSRRVWLTPGNNDNLSAVEGRKAEVYPNGARVEAFGLRLELNHIAIPAAWGVDFALYGHGPTDDLRYPLPDEPGDVTYLNGNYHWTVIDASTKRFVHIPFREPAKCARIFIARHGQVVPETCIGGDHNLPREDYCITPHGVRQACYLAEEMRRLRFQGRILCSPFTRTLLTAQPVSRATGCPIYLEPRFREIVKESQFMGTFQGRTLDSMRSQFPEIAPDATLPYPWWTAEEEQFEDVCERIAPLLDELIAGEGDTFLMGHGASTAAAVHLLMQKSGKAFGGFMKTPDGGNCALSLFRVVNGVVHPLRVYSVSHMPLTMATSNRDFALTKEDV